MLQIVGLDHQRNSSLKLLKLDELSVQKFVADEHALPVVTC